MRQILYTYVFVIALCLAGCMSPDIVYEKYENGSRTARIAVRTADYPAGDSYIVLEGERIVANVSASQDAKGIIGAKGSSKGMVLAYIACGIIAILGICAFAMPNNIISNRDGLIITGVGLAGFAGLRWVEASVPVMMWLLPVVAVCGGLYLVVVWLSKKR
jgi:hypothetical protein